MKTKFLFLVGIFCLIQIFGNFQIVNAMPRVAVMPFVNKVPVKTDLSEKADLDIALEAATFAVRNTNKFELCERAELSRVLDEMSLGKNPLFDSSTCAKIGKLLGAQYIVLGSVSGISRLNNSDKINVSVYARMIEVETARVMLAGRGSAKGTVGMLNETIEKAVDSAMTGKQGMLTQFFKSGK